MKILYINTVYSRGSTGRIIREIAEYAKSKGNEYSIATREKANAEFNNVQTGSIFTLYEHAFLSRITDRAGFYSKCATRKLVQYIKSYNPDIIHLHNLHGYYLNIPILFDFLQHEYSGKIVWTLHDCWPLTGHCVHYTNQRCDRWKSGCYDCPQKKTYPQSYFIDSSKRNYNQKKALFRGLRNMTIVTVSKWLMSQVQQSFLGEYHVQCIYNGVDMEKFKPVESDIKYKLGLTGKRMVLTVADGFDDRKGKRFLLNVAKNAPSDWRFVIVGVAKNDLKSLPQNIIGLERTGNQQELVELYSAADVFFNPSLEETFGLVTAEAMSCGTPAVVMNSTASPELILDSSAGTIIEPDLAADEVIRVLDETMAKTQARNAIQRFSTDNQCKEYYLLYEKMINASI